MSSQYDSGYRCITVKHSYASENSSSNRKLIADRKYIIDNIKRVFFFIKISTCYQIESRNTIRILKS
jgi:hypothetical protein